MGSPREKTLARLVPACIAGLFCVTAFCWAETHFAPALGRLPMGHELVRGLRFLAPLGWLLIVGGIGCLAGKWPRRAILAGAIAATLVLCADRQYMAAQYAIANISGFDLPLADAARKEEAQALQLREVFAEIKKIVPEGESIYCPEDAMQARYLALRPLAHSFKDGYVHFYNKDVKASERWLELEKLAASGPNGWLAAWKESGAPWLLCRRPADPEALEKGATIEMDKNGWLLCRALAVTRQ